MSAPAVDEMKGPTNSIGSGGRGPVLRASGSELIMLLTEQADRSRATPSSIPGSEG